jgi:hypothetical protein
VDAFWFPPQAKDANLAGCVKNYESARLINIRDTLGACREADENWSKFQAGGISKVKGLVPKNGGECFCIQEQDSDWYLRRHLVSKKHSKCLTSHIISKKNSLKYPIRCCSIGNNAKILTTLEGKPDSRKVSN